MDLPSWNTNLQVNKNNRHSSSKGDTSELDLTLFRQMHHSFIVHHHGCKQAHSDIVVHRKLYLILPIDKLYSFASAMEVDGRSKMDKDC